MFAISTYSSSRTVSASTTSASVQLPSASSGNTNILVYNPSAVRAFVVSGVTAPTAVMPTTSWAAGKIIPPGAFTTFSVPVGHAFLAFILESGTATIDVSVDDGGI